MLVEVFRAIFFGLLFFFLYFYFIFRESAKYAVRLSLPLACHGSLAEGGQSFSNSSAADPQPKQPPPAQSETKVINMPKFAALRLSANGRRMGSLKPRLNQCEVEFAYEIRNSKFEIRTSTSNKYDKYANFG